MCSPNNSHYRSNIFRIFVKNGKEQEDEPFLRIVQVIREGDEIRVDLPEGREALETGWFPQIVHRLGAEADTLDLVVSPKLPSAITAGEEAAGAAYRADTQPSSSNQAAPTLRQIFPGLREGVAPEPLPPPPDEVLFEITFIKREIRLNRSVISRPNYDSENELVFDYLYRHPNRKVELQEIEAEIHRPVHKRLSEIIRDLGFKKELRNMFFPDISKSAIRFINPITRADFQQRRLKLPKIRIE